MDDIVMKIIKVIGAISFLLCAIFLIYLCVFTFRNNYSTLGMVELTLGLLFFYFFLKIVAGQQKNKTNKCSLREAGGSI